MKNKSNIFMISAIGVFAALVFVASMLSVPIPVAIGDVSRIHLGNIFCLLSGLILGPLGGGLAAGIGSGIYDLTNPAYIASAPITFIFKFLMAFVAGIISAKFVNDETKRSRNIIVNIGACAAGQIVYIILYLAKSFISGILEGSAPGAMVPVIITKLGTSSINAVIAIIFAVPLCFAVKAALKKSKLID